MEEKNEAIPAPVTHFPDLSPDLVHQNIMRCFKLGNCVTRRMLDWLLIHRAFPSRSPRGDAQQSYSVDVGLSGPVEYVMKNLKCGHTEAYSLVKAAIALPGFPLTAEAFEKGRASLSQVKAITRLKSAKKEEAWLEFAGSHTVQELCEAIEDAVSNDRDSPRPKGSGLLNRRVDLKIRLTRSDREIVRKALEKKAAALVASGKVKPSDLSKEKVLTTMAIEELEKDDATGESERTRSFCDLVLHVCSQCGERRMITPEGPVAMTKEEAKPLEAKARKLEILFEEEYVRGEALPPGEVAGDLPVETERKVLALGGRSCANCGRRLGLHVHHIIFRSRGGANDLPNLICACARCHEAVHLGTLKAFRDSDGEVLFLTRAEKLTALLEDEVKELVAIPAVSVVEVEVPARPAPSTPPVPPEPPPFSTAPESSKGSAGGEMQEEEKPAKKKAFDDSVLREANRIARGLERTLGYTDARERVAKALDLLGGLDRSPTPDEIVNAAVRGCVVAPRVGVSGAAERYGSGAPPADRRRQTPPPRATDAGAGPAVS